MFYDSSAQCIQIGYILVQCIRIGHSSAQGIRIGSRVLRCGVGNVLGQGIVR